MERWRSASPFGPALWRELRTLSRRPAVFVARLSLVLAASGVLGAYLAWLPPTQGGPRALAELGGAFFAVLAWAQLGLLTLLTPALVGGLVAQERERRTLTLLLTTDLSAGEIVGGKLLSRVGVLAAVVLATVPLLTLVGLFGGIEIGRACASAAVTLAATTALAAVGLWFSVRARRTWVAVAQTYFAALAAWVVLPWTALLLAGLGAVPRRLLWLAAGQSPLAPLGHLTDSPPAAAAGMGAGTVGGTVAASIAWHLAVAGLATALAAWSLRRPLPESRQQRRQRRRDSRGVAPRRRLTRLRQALLDRHPLLHRAVTVGTLDPEGKVRRLQWLWLVVFGALLVATRLTFSAQPLVHPILAVSGWLQFGMHLFATVLASATLAGPRSDGGLDPLLLTELRDRDFVHGALTAAAVAVRPLVLAVTALTAYATAAGQCDVAFAAVYLVLAVALLLHVVAAAVLASAVAVRPAAATAAAVVVTGYHWSCWLPGPSGVPVHMAGMAALLVVPGLAAVLVAPAERRRQVTHAVASLLMAAAAAGIVAYVVLFWTIDANRLVAESPKTFILVANVGATVFLAGCVGLVFGPALRWSGRHAPTVAALGAGWLMPLALVGVLNLTVGIPRMLLANRVGPQQTDVGTVMSFPHWTAGAVREVGADRYSRGGVLEPPLGWLPGGWRGGVFYPESSLGWGWIAVFVYGGSGLILAALACRAFGRMRRP